jgi:hypothetical protein
MNQFQDGLPIKPYQKIQLCDVVFSKRTKHPAVNGLISVYTGKLCKH